MLTGGLIPAWAGKTGRRNRPCAVHQAHPRVGGENVNEARVLTGDGGSSPRGRGKRPDIEAVLPRRRLIPAWAGKTAKSGTPRRRAGAHPRVGGENRGHAGRPEQRRGSSPRGRGKRCAWMSSRIRPRAHPRVGGENETLTLRVGEREGSSPRGRGKRRGRPCRPQRRGLIPAWAGKTRARRVFRRVRRAHPRVGGENRPSISTVLVVSGSSPRGRGKLPRRVRPRRRYGLIPAWAGKTI
mgnify:CR=1 FL=1